MSESASGEASSSTDASDKEFSCPECGKGYTTSNGLKYHLKKTECDGYGCPTCGETHFRTNHAVNVHHSKVHGESLNTQTVKCDYCGDPVERYINYIKKVPHIFCKGRECANKWKSENLVRERSGGWKGGKVTVDCVICGEEKEVYPYRVEDHARHFCSSNCRGEWAGQRYQKEDHPNWKGGWKWYYGDNWDEQRQKALERDNYTCRYCGKGREEMDRSPDVHHLKPLREYRNDPDIGNPYEQGNRLNNLVTACKECHARWEGIPLRPT